MANKREHKIFIKLMYTLAFIFITITFMNKAIIDDSIRIYSAMLVLNGFSILYVFWLGHSLGWEQKRISIEEESDKE